MRILARIVTVVVILGAVLAVGYVTIGDSSTAVAIRQWFTGVFRAAAEPILNWLGRFARRSVTRQFTNALWRVTIGLAIALTIRYYFGGSKVPLYRRFVRIRIHRNRATRWATAPFRKAMGAQIPIPRWTRACVGIVVVGLLLWFFVIVGHIFGETWSGWFGSIAFAVVVFYVVEKLPVLGFDALLAIIGEKWRWMKEHPRVAYIVRGKPLERLVHSIVVKVSRRKTL